MKNLFVRKQEWIEGVLFIKKTDVEQVANDLIYINTIMGRDDEGDLFDLLETAILNTESSDKTIHLPVITTKKIWKKIKESGKVKLVATTEKKAAKPEVKGLVLI